MPETAAQAQASAGAGAGAPDGEAAQADPWLTHERPVNIAQHLPEVAARTPRKPAVIFPEGRDRSGRVSWTHLTFAQLEAETNALARGLEAFGVHRGERVLVMVTPSLEFIAVTFSLFKVGAVPVLIDPGMGRTHLLDCIARVEPTTLVGVPKAHAASLAFPAAFRTIERRVTVGARWLWGGVTYDELAATQGAGYPLAPTRGTDPAAILFTTGSTGPPKGVRYLHGIFDAQVHMIRRTYGLTAEDVDLPGFPLFALFSTAWGMSCVIPDMDPTRPAQVDPVKILEAMDDWGVTTSFGSPAIWNRVSLYCLREGARMPGMKRILMAGAPIPGNILARFPALMPDGETYTPYGATECLPTASISGSEILGETWARTQEGAGTCVGRPLPGNTIRILRPEDGVLEEWDEARVLGPGEIGEVVVRGPVVTPGYFGQPDHTARAKIRDGDALWHRMGDMGYLDDQGRLWFCGRKGHRVQVSGRVDYTIPVEQIFNTHPKVFRSAVVDGGGEAVLVVEPEAGDWPRVAEDREAFVAELRELGGRHDTTRHIETFLFHESFPVDIRHNAKIFREKLAVWARQQLGR